MVVTSHWFAVGFPAVETRGMTDRLSKNEIRKDAVQNTVEATVNTVSEVGGILSGAIKGVVGAVGNLATEVFEIRDAARKAQAAHGVDEE